MKTQTDKSNPCNCGAFEFPHTRQNAKCRKTTPDDMDKFILAVNEYDALNAVAEAAKDFIHHNCGVAGEGKVETSHRLEKALANLAAIRKP